MGMSGWSRWHLDHGLFATRGTALCPRVSLEVGGRKLGTRRRPQETYIMGLLQFKLMLLQQPQQLPSVRRKPAESEILLLLPFPSFPSSSAVVDAQSWPSPTTFSWALKELSMPLTVSDGPNMTLSKKTCFPVASPVSLLYTSLYHF